MGHLVLETSVNNLVMLNYIVQNSAIWIDFKTWYLATLSCHASFICFYGSSAFFYVFLYFLSTPFNPYLLPHIPSVIDYFLVAFLLLLRVCPPPTVTVYCTIRIAPNSPILLYCLSSFLKFSFCFLVCLLYLSLQKSTELDVPKTLPEDQYFLIECPNTVPVRNQLHLQITF